MCVCVVMVDCGWRIVGFARLRGNGIVADASVVDNKHLCYIYKLCIHQYINPPG